MTYKPTIFEFIILWHLLLSLDLRNGYIGKRGHGQADTYTRTRRAAMEKTDSFGKDGQVWKRRTVLEKTDSFGKDGQLWKRRAVMEKTDRFGKKRTVMEKANSFGKDGQLWKRWVQKHLRLFKRL